MKLEVIRIREVKLPSGDMGSILDLDDFKRLVSTYKITFHEFRDKFGLSRSLWSNTLLFYKLSSQDIFSWRNLIVTHTQLHLNSNHGFSRVIEGQDMVQIAPPNKLEGYLDRLIPLCPKIKELWYSKISHDPTSLSQDLSNISRDLIESKEVLKKVMNRCRKYAIKNGVEYKRCISSPLEHAIAKILDDLGLSYTPQWFIKPYHYDFYLPTLKIILEVDGSLHNKRFDIKKEKKALKKGFVVKRVVVERKGIKKINYEEYKNKISKALGLSGSI